MTKKYRSMLIGGTLNMMIVTLLSVADFIIAGVLLGDDAVAGINLAIPLYSFAIFLGSLCSIGIPILYSREMGKFNQAKADQTFGFGLGMNVIAGILVMVFSLLAGNAYLSFFDPSESVFHYAEGYLFWMSFVFLILPLQSYLREMIFADGDEVLSAIVSIVQTVGNIPLSIILCHSMGSAGIALGTLLATALSIPVALAHFPKKTNSLRINLYFSRPMMKSVVKYSMIDASAYIYVAIYVACLEKYTVWRFGAETLIIVAVILLLAKFTLVFDGIGMAITPIISMYLGEGSYQGVRNTYRIAKMTCVIEGLVLTVAVFLAAPLLPKVLGIYDPGMIELAVSCTRIVSLSYVFISLLYLLPSYYLLRGKIGLGAAICGLRDVVISIPLAILLGNIFGIYGMFAGLALTPLLATAISALYILFRYGRAEYPLLITEQEKQGGFVFFEFDIRPEEVLRIRDEAEKVLRARQYDDKTVISVMLLIEEMFMLVYDLNEGIPVMGECTLVMRDNHIEIIEKDNGRPFDLTDEDMPVTSLRAYLISTFAGQRTQKKQHLMTISSNRNVFEIKVGEKSQI